VPVLHGVPDAGKALRLELLLGQRNAASATNTLGSMSGSSAARRAQRRPRAARHRPIRDQALVGAVVAGQHDRFAHAADGAQFASISPSSMRSRDFAKSLRPGYSTEPSGNQH
jgi:hypothetical protein